MKLSNLVLSFALAAPMFVACGGMEYDLEQGVEGDDLAETEDAATTSVCAIGTDPNYVSNQLTSVGATATYTRAAAWPTAICPVNSRRNTTFVDFPVPGYYQHQFAETYSFHVEANFNSISSTSWSNVGARSAECGNLQMAVRLQRWDSATSSFVQLTYQEPQPSWVFTNFGAGIGHCDVPEFLYYHENYGTAQQVATNKYRVRTWARHPDGSLADVWVTGMHTGL